jgi:hypothetical protein
MMPAESALAAYWFIPGFNQGKQDQNVLSVLANRDEALFIISSEQGKLQGVVRLRNTALLMQSADPAGLRMRVEASGLPPGRYRRACLILRSQRYSILPSAVAKEVDPLSILSVRHSIRKGEQVLQHSEDDLSSFFVDRPALSLLLKEYSLQTQISNYGMLVAREAIRISAGREEVLLADLGSRSLDVAMAGKNGLTFINAFPVRTAEDAAYHFLNVWRSLDKPVRIVLTGEFASQGRTPALISPYIGEYEIIHTDKIPPGAEIPGGTHDLLLLLNHLPCVS